MENGTKVHVEDGFETINGRRMYYEPGNVVACPDAMYMVEKGGNWVKFAELHRKKGWRILRFNEALLDKALAEMERQRAIAHVKEESMKAPGDSIEAVEGAEVEAKGPEEMNSEETIDYLTDRDTADESEAE